MRIVAILFSGIFFFAQSSCKSQHKSIVEVENQNDSGIVLVDSDDFSGILEQENLVINDAKSLNAFYGKINRTRKPGLPVPVIDFSKHTALIVCAGEQKPNTKMILSYGDESDKELTINIKTKNSTAKDEALITVVAYPFYLYTIPLTDKSIDIRYQ